VTGCGSSPLWIFYIVFGSHDREAAVRSARPLGRAEDHVGLSPGSMSRGGAAVRRAPWGWIFATYLMGRTLRLDTFFTRMSLVGHVFRLPKNRPTRVTVMTLS
jgi:hypothetical protein